MKVLVAGGDGFIGWPLSMRLSKLGYQVKIIDNLYRRKIDQQNGFSTIVTIKTIQQRIARWKQVTGLTILYQNIDLSEQKEKFFTSFQNWKPDVVVHLAEQKSAPYSMKNAQKIDETYTNNTQSTKNILIAMLKYNQDCHMVHIGTMGVYGYGAVQGGTIPQGFCMAKLNCVHTEKCDCKPIQIVHPYYPGSVYHMTKCLDNVTLLNFQKFFGLKITELHQGIVWGQSTPETQLHPDFANRLDVDSDFGTVMNRFCSQVACGYPISLYGTGEQTRAFININDSLQCLTLAIQYGKKNDFTKVHILNQMTACHRLNDIKDFLLELYPDAKYEYINNPRKELASNDLVVKNDKFKNLGYKGIEINKDDVIKLVELCRENKQRFQKNIEFIKPISFWKK